MRRKKLNQTLPNSYKITKQSLLPLHIWHDSLSEMQNFTRNSLSL